MRKSNLYGLLAAICATNMIVAADPAQSPPPKNNVASPVERQLNDYDEAILSHFKIKTDTASLIAYLQDHSAADGDLLNIDELVKQLANNPFADPRSPSGKLVALGLPAVRRLSAALNDADPERVRMAKATLKRMDRGTGTVSIPPAAIRLLMKRQPPELLEVLLRYLPFATDRELEEDIYFHINELASPKNKDYGILVKALGDRLPARRAVAGCIVARNGNAEQKELAKKLLADADANVRLRAAQGFLAGFDKAGIPALIELLEAKPESIAWQAEELLHWASGDDRPPELVWSGGERATKARLAWAKWWRNAEATIDLDKVAKSGKRPGLFAGASVVFADLDCHIGRSEQSPTFLEMSFFCAMMS